MDEGERGMDDGALDRDAGEARRIRGGFCDRDEG